MTPSLAVNAGGSNYFRGAALGGQALYDLGIIALGLELKVDYDSWFNVFTMPLLLLVGFGRDFWFGAGYTLALGSIDIGGDAWQLGSSPNTFAVGANILRLPLPFASLLVQSEISYTVNSEMDSEDMMGLDIYAAIIYGLKGSVGVGMELKL